MQPSSSFPHRHNFDGSYDSICTKCYATVARAEKEESLSSSESTHVCHTMAPLYLAREGPIPAYTPMLGLVAWSSGAAADKSGPTHHRRFPLRTEIRLTVKPDRVH
jgi:hypothetical protein